MKSAKLTAGLPRARARRAARIAGSAEDAVEALIYKAQRMDTLPAMFKRILVLLAASALGFAACAGALRFTAAWSLFPNRDLDRSSAYVREVLKIVNENYVDPGASHYDALARLAIQIGRAHV
jgi:hypothetical protein